MIGSVAKGRWSFFWLLLMPLDAGGLTAAEPFREFLAALRTQGYYEEAIDYLDSMRSSSAISEELKQTIAYEQGLTLIDQAATLRDLSFRDQVLDRARERLKEFLQSQPGHPLTAAANNQLANILVERARTFMARSEREPDKESLLGQARVLLGEAENVFAAALDSARTQLEQFDETHGKHLPESETALIEQRDRLRQDRLQAELLTATVVYEMSKTAEPESPGRQRLLARAAKQYNALYANHGKRLGGLYARMYEGRCYQELGEIAKAIDIYDELLGVLGDVDDFRPLKTKTLRHALECWVQTKKWGDAFEKALPLVRRAATLVRDNPDEAADWTAVRYLTAVALKQHAEKSEQGAQRRNYLNEAQDLAEDVARSQGEFQAPARALLVAMGQKAPDEAAPARTKFDEAFELAKAAVDEREGLVQAIALARENNKTAVAGLQKQLVQKTQEAIDGLSQALKVKAVDTPPDSVNQARYLLAYLMFQTGRHYEAAALGEFVARKYPKSPLAQHCAEIALKSYQSLRGQGADTAFADRRIERIGEYIAGAWPNQPLADSALQLLIDVAIRRGDFARAGTYADKMGAGSQLRAETEIRVGHALWVEYDRRVKEDEKAAATADVAALIQQAQTRLEQGLAGLKKANSAGELLPLAGLWLGQLYLNTSQPDKALTTLEDEPAGPLALIEKDHASTRREGFAVEVYMTALRTYISVEPQQIEKAISTLDRLEKSVGDDPKDSEKLIARLMVMGKSLEDQLQDLRRRKETQRILEVSEGFHKFLAIIVEKAKSFNSLNWAATTYSGLAGGLVEPGSAPPPEAVTYFEQAVAAYRKALEMAPNAETKLAIRVRIAATYRQAGKYKEATDALVEVLTERPQMLAAQIDAAYTYQERADSGEKPGYYYGLAIKGGRQGALWGWGKISLLTANNSNFVQQFHEARYNLALCRYLQATSERSDASAGQLKIAKDEIRATLALFPEMGGPERKKQYEALLRKIQSELGDTSAPGLAEFEAAPAPAADGG